MAVALVGSVGTATSASSPITGSYGQSPTAGNLLVAVVTWQDLTVETFNPTATTGWTRLTSGATGNNASGTSHAGVDFWYKVAAGSDSAPQFTQTSSGTFKFTCLIFELSGANTTTPLDTQGTPYQSGSTALSASPTMTPVSAANVTAAGEYAISAFCQSNGSSSTQTWTELGSYGSIYSDAGTNSNAHTQCSSLANPSSGSTTSDSGHFSTGTTNIYAAAQLVVIAASSTNFAGAASLSGTGTLTSQPVVNFVSAASLSGTGTLASQPVVNFAAAASLSGTGSLTAQPVVNFLGAASLSGTGSLTSQAVVNFLAAASLSGTGLLTSQPVVNFPRAATLSGTGAMTSAGVVNFLGAASLTGTGSLTSAALVNFLAAASLSGTGTLTSVQSVAYGAAAALSGTGVLIATATVTHPTGAFVLIAGAAMTEWDTRKPLALWATGSLLTQWDAGIPEAGGGPAVYTATYTATYEAGPVLTLGAPMTDWAPGDPAGS